jgi:catechol 2,3-dioxygenase-like lactoylglutathione lyase family enzyme
MGFAGMVRGGKVSTTGERSNDAHEIANLDMQLEVVVVPVADVDRAKEFYGQLGWRLDADRTAGDIRLIQFTPPGSACSVQFGTNLTSAAPGSAEALVLTVSDIEGARDELARRGIEIGEVFHCPSGTVCRFQSGAADRVNGAAPDHASYFSFVSFNDPDGNNWLLQEVTTRLPGRVDPLRASFDSASELASALRRAEAAHGEHEKRIGAADANWPDWYAKYMVAEKAGAELPL